MAPTAQLLPGNLGRARFYQLTPLGHRAFAPEQSSWQRLVDAIARSLAATPPEI